MESGQLIYKLEELNEAVKVLNNCLNKCSVLALIGDLGTGKTTLVKALLKERGITDTITSPTYAYMCKYKNTEGKSFYHFDLYRMRSASEFFDAGFDEMLFLPNSYSIIEWPEIIMPFLKEQICTLSLEHFKNNQRLLKYSC